MIDSRKLEDLHPTVHAMATSMIAKCKEAGIDILVTCTYRDVEFQNSLYARGRTVKGTRVTNAKGGQSAHNFRLAFDVVPMRYGKPVWGTKGEDLLLWQKVGAIGESVGLEWGGHWRTFIDYPHFQYMGGHPLSHFQNGGHL